MTYKELHEELRQKLEEDYGSKCKVFYYSCPVCQVYMALDIIESCADLEGMDLKMGIVSKAIHGKK